eukprot:Nitzschia sp. Nitz4//scaffold28_size193895//122490//123920//NITZ4_001669-RA/size193895-augustus-gene-0.296-mRNA-1//1//CDS//3329545994//8785//frame0
MKLVLISQLLFAWTISAGKIKGLLKKNDIPSSDKDWVTFDNGVMFQPGDDVDVPLEHVRKLWSSNEESGASVFVDGTETYYDDYAQAWRLLGFYIDCGHCEDDSYSSESLCIANGQDTTCQRYLLWAAYVDPDYSGNGAGEYMYYDRTKKRWNTGACKESGSERCVRMDCHEPTSHYKLLGTFKEPDYSNFLDQLFQYQGDCVWTDDEYKHMQSTLATWPQACTEAANGIYYDVKPEVGGGMGVGLYSDAKCVETYDGEVTVEEVMTMVANDGSSDVSNVDEGIEAWNSAFDAFKLCQPCMTTNLLSLTHESVEMNADGDRYQHLDNADGDDVFTCQEGSSGVNQCAIFSSNTNMLTASYHDIILAEEQGTVGSISLAGINFGISEHEESTVWQRNFLSAIFLMGCFCLFVVALMRCQEDCDSSDLKRPLVSKERESNRRKSGRNNSTSNSSS